MTTIGLTVLKLRVAHVSHSVSIFSEGIHSALDLVSAALSFFTVRQSVKPADEDHPYGHGKIETLSSLFESILLIVAAGVIVYEGIEHLLHPQPLEHGGMAIAVILVSIGLSYAVYRHNLSAARDTESSALRVNAIHFLSDVVASVGVLVGLLLMKLTHWAIIDPIAAFVVAFYILFISLQQVKMALFELVDTQLPLEEVQLIRSLLDGFHDQFHDKFIDAHDLRTRKSGANRHIDFHLRVCGNMSVNVSHSMCDEIESKIMQKFPHAFVNIHVEPCEKHQKHCHADCQITQKIIPDE